MQKPFSSLTKSQILYRIAAVLMILIIVDVLFLLNQTLGRNITITLNIIFAWFEMVFYMCLFLFCHSASIHRNTQYRLFPILLFVNFINLFLAVLLTLLDGNPDLAKPLLLLAILYLILFCVSTTILFLFLSETVVPAAFRRSLLFASNAIILVLIIVAVSSYFTGAYVNINENGYLEFPGDVYAISAQIALHGLYLLFLSLSKRSLQDKLALSSYTVFPLIYDVLFIFNSDRIGTAISYPVDFFPALLSICVIFFNVYLNDQQELLYQRMEMAEKKQALAEQEKKQLELKTSIMLSQIQPHFLYNALSAIYVLCTTDPAEAARTVDEFATYLRMNMSSLQSNHLVPFKEELAHTQTYRRIEKLRFGDMLHIVYDIRYEDVSRPPLTLHPV